MAASSSFEDRAAGAIMGAFIGDALGVGPHWYYDLDELRADYGWVTDYTDPKPGRYHQGVKAGEPSQCGIILELVLRSLVEKGGYDEHDFCARMDDLFTKIDGNKPMSGPGGYTSQSIRETWRRRVEQGLPWGPQTSAGHADTTEAIERALAIAVRYAAKPSAAADFVASNAALTQADEVVQSITVAFCAALGQLVQGHPFDGELSTRLFQLNKDARLPFHSVTRGTNAAPPDPNDPEPPSIGRYASPDALGTPSTCAKAAADPDTRINPAWKVALLYGKPCAIYHIVPACYYLAAMFASDFEAAVVNAVNGGGQNLARAMLTGALVGAQVGLSGIPKHFLSGLSQSEQLVDLAQKLAKTAAADV